jgi:glycosyltransferase involved in cell wall biosynthesis
VTRSTRKGAGETRPLVSICIPTYQSARWIGATLDSLVRQTYPSIEIHVLDDGSTDDTAAVVRSFATNGVTYHRFDQNLGAYGNKNRALDFARGELLTWYNADDVYDPTIVEREVEFLARHPEAAAVLCMDRWIDEEGRPTGSTRDTLPPEFRGGGSFDRATLVAALMRHRNILMRFPTLMTRTVLVREAGPFDQARFGLSADVDMYLRLARFGPVGIIDEELMSYRSFPGQWTARERWLRTDRDSLRDVIDHHAADPAVSSRIDERTAARDRYHARADDTRRAANAIILGRRADAAEILRTRRDGRVAWPAAPMQIAKELVTRSMVRAAAHRIAPVRAVAPALGWMLYRNVPKPSLPSHGTATPERV